MLKIKSLSKVIENTVLLKSIDFTIEEGDIVGLIGPNGAGKTTTLKILLGLINCTTGEIVADDISISEDRAHYLRKVGYISDSPFFYEELTGEEFLIFTTELWGRKYSKSSFVHLIHTLALTEVMNKPIHTYSYGMKKKLSILVALINEPKYLIMDEPFNGIDVISIHNIKSFLFEYVKQGNGVLISSHIIDSIESLCSQVCIINKGEQITFEGIEKLKLSNSKKSVEEIFIEKIMLHNSFGN